MQWHVGQVAVTQSGLDRTVIQGFQSNIWATFHLSLHYSHHQGHMHSGLPEPFASEQAIKALASLAPTPVYQVTTFLYGKAMRYFAKV